MKKSTKKTVTPLQVWQTDTLKVTDIKHIKRLSWNNLTHEIGEAFNLNKGLLYTLKGLTLSPAATIREYLDAGRYRILSPFKYFLLVMAVYVFVGIKFGMFEQMNDLVNFGNEGLNREEISNEFAQWFGELYKNYVNLFQLILVFTTSIFSYLLYRKKGFNFIEHNVINLYVSMHPIWLNIPFIILSYYELIGFSSNLWITLLNFVYLWIVYKNLFEENWGKSLVKAISVTMLGTFLFGFMMMIVSLIFLVATKV